MLRNKYLLKKEIMTICYEMFTRILSYKLFDRYKLDMEIIN